MRRLMWFSIGFAGACLIGAYLVSNWYLSLIAIAAVVIGIGLCLLKKKYGGILLTAAIGFFIGVVWMQGYDVLYLEPVRQYGGQRIATEIEISDYSRDTDYGIAADGKIKLDGKSYNVYVYLKGKPLLPGDVIKGNFELRFTAQGGEQEATYHPGKGIFLLAYAKGETQTQRPGKIPAKFFAAQLRRNIQNTLDLIFQEDTVGFARALFLGDTSRLSAEDDTAFKVSGIRHIIAVSGLHVTILFSLVYTLFGKRRVPTAIVGIPILILFAAVAGFTPSVVRACIMQGLVILGLLLKKEYDSPTALAFAVLTMLLINPLTITSVSFQLSVGCMIGIFLFCGRINRFLLRILRAPKDKSIRAKLTRWLAGCAAVSVSATVVTAPLSAYYFGTISIIGILTNVLTIWVVSATFYGIMLSCIAGGIWIGAGRVVAWIVSWPIRYVLCVARLTASIPIAAVYVNNIYILLWLVFSYVLLLAFLKGKRKHPFVFAGCVIAGLCLSLIFAYTEPRTEDFRVTVLDVGQGQSIVLQSQDKTYLVDCGGDSGSAAADIAAQHLLSQGIAKLDGLILTHYDDDHAGGVDLLLNRVPADVLYLPDSTDDGEIKLQLTDAFRDKICWVTDTMEWSGPWGTLTLFPGSDKNDDNESGLCILFQAADCDILITGDWTSAQEFSLVQAVALPELELLVVGHHGSRSATSLPLLAETNPKAAVISVGRDNPYGHPSGEVIQRLESFGCKIWRTDLDGTITFGR